MVVTLRPLFLTSRSDWYQARPKLLLRAMNAGSTLPSSRNLLCSTVNMSNARPCLMLRSWMSSGSFSLPRLTVTLADGGRDGSSGKAARQRTTAGSANRLNCFWSTSWALPTRATAIAATTAARASHMHFSERMVICILPPDCRGFWVGVRPGRQPCHGPYALLRRMDADVQLAEDKRCRQRFGDADQRRATIRTVDERRGSRGDLPRVPCPAANPSCWSTPAFPRTRP